MRPCSSDIASERIGLYFRCLAGVIRGQPADSVLRLREEGTVRPFRGEAAASAARDSCWKSPPLLYSRSATSRAGGPLPWPDGQPPAVPGGAERIALTLIRLFGEKRIHWAMVVIGIVDRKSTRLNSSHLGISYAVFCL